MNAMDLKIGTKLELAIIDSMGQKADYTYTSQLLDIINESNIVIACPMRESRLIPIPISTRVEVVFVDEKRRVMCFEAIVTDRSNKDNIAVVHVCIDSEISRIQRRQFFRLDCLLDAQYRFLSGKSEEGFKDKGGSEKVEYKKAVTSDLSGSGVCIVTDESIPKGSIIEVHISLGKENTVKAIASAVRSFRAENTTTVKYKNGLHFVNISKADRDLVIKYLFNHQRELLKKGLLTK